MAPTELGAALASLADTLAGLRGDLAEISDRADAAASKAVESVSEVRGDARAAVAAAEEAHGAAESARRWQVVLAAGVTVVSVVLLGVVALLWQLHSLQAENHRSLVILRHTTGPEAATAQKAAIDDAVARIIAGVTGQTTTTTTTFRKP